MALATRPDVEARLGPVETPEKRLLVQTLLDAAEARLVSRIPDLVVKSGLDAEFRANAVSVEADAVARVMRNPEGFRSENTGPFQNTYDTRAAAGFLTILKEEWRLLGVSGAFTITPSLPPVDTMPFQVYDLLYGWR